MHHLRLAAPASRAAALDLAAAALAAAAASAAARRLRALFLPIAPLARCGR